MRLLIVTMLATGAVTPLHFADAKGWHSGSVKAQPCQGAPVSRCAQAWSWTATVGWKDCASCSPHNTVRSLPADGIVISASVVTEHPVKATKRTAWPPRVSASQVTGSFEGLPARIGVYQLFAAIGNGKEIDLTMFFGRAHPTKEQLARANARLAAARLG